ncbi:MAG: EF-P lysine aminoacylase EpmA [Geminicoccaceae bacterium]
MTRPSPWWHSHRHADRRPFLIDRQSILRTLRDYFEGEGFIEVETPILQISPGNEIHLHAFRTELLDTAGCGRGHLYLHTSPEFAMKKLLAAGEQRLFTFARCFRNRELGSRHHPEFTMLEWYRARESHDVLMTDCEEILCRSAQALGRNQLQVAGIDIPLIRPFERLSVADALMKFAGIDLFAVSDIPAFREAARCCNVRTGDDDSWSDIFSRVLVERIEPNLGHDRPTFLIDYPLSEAALARAKADDPRLAERFELYAAGMELANGFGELTDPVEQRRRFAADMDEKEKLYGERYPIDEDFIEALATMPEASGIALGFDRLVMAVTGARQIEQVIWAPTSFGGLSST